MSKITPFQTSNVPTLPDSLPSSSAGSAAGSTAGSTAANADPKPILDYFSNLWAIPLVSDTKFPPKGRSFEQTRTQASVLTARGTGHAVLMHLNCLAVVDVDDKPDRGQFGYQSLARLSEAVGFELPDTLKVITPSGGVHYYYSYAGTELAGNSSPVHGSNAKLYWSDFILPNTRDDNTGAAKDKISGLDIKLGNGYVVSPTSPKHQYTLAPDSLPAPAQCPDWLYNYLFGKTVKSGSESGSEPSSGPDLNPNFNINSDPNLSPSAQQELVTWLESQPVIVSGERNDGVLYLACRLLERGVSVDDATRLIFEHGQISPMLDFAEVRRVTANAGKYCELEPIAMSALPALSISADHTSANLGKNGGVPAHSTAVNPEDCLTLEELTAKTSAPRDWLVEGWLPAAEISMLYGDGGSGKSLIAAQLAFATATGGAWLGGQVMRPRPVIYVACEDSTSELGRRFKDIIRHSSEYANNVPNDIASAANVHNNTSSQDISLPLPCPLLIWPWRGRDTYLCSVDRAGNLKTTAAYNCLQARIAALAAAAQSTEDEPTGVVVILDTLANFFSGDELSRAQVQSFINRIIGGLGRSGMAEGDATSEFKHTVVLLAHTNKTGQYSGSTAWNNAVAARLTLTRKTAPAGIGKSQEVNLDAENGNPLMSLIQEKSNYGPCGGERQIYYDSGIFKVSDPKIKEDKNIDLIRHYLLNRERAKDPILWPVKRGHACPDGVPPADMSAHLSALISVGEVQVVDGAQFGLKKGVKCLISSSGGSNESNTAGSSKRSGREEKISALPTFEELFG